MNKEKNVPIYIVKEETKKLDIKEFVFLFSNQLYLEIIKKNTMLIAIMFFVFLIVVKELFIPLLIFGGIELAMLIYCKVHLEKIIVSIFYNNIKNIEDDKVTIEFFDHNILKKSNNQILNILYRDIEKIIETSKNIYIKCKDNKNIIFISKHNIDKEAKEFIYKKIRHIEIMNNDKIKEEMNMQKKIDNCFFILFILTIGSLLASLESLYIIKIIVTNYKMEFINYSWVCWLWLPLPIITVIYGLKNYSSKYKKSKQIIRITIAILTSIIIIISGLLFIIPIDKEYKSIKEYEKIIGCVLPQNGKVEVKKSNKREKYKIIQISYKKENVYLFTKSIENNKKWILINEVDNNIVQQLFGDIDKDDITYISIYNKTIDEYNKLPKIKGDYEIYFMIYSKSNKELEIHQYIYHKK